MEFDLIVYSKHTYIHKVKTERKESRIKYLKLFFTGKISTMLFPVNFRFSSISGVGFIIWNSNTMIFLTMIMSYTSWLVLTFRFLVRPGLGLG